MLQIAAGSRPEFRIEVRALQKSFTNKGRSFTAVDDVSFGVAEGEFVALLGPSGCGKSTILNMVAGLIAKTSGEIWIDRKQIEPGEVRNEIGYVFQRDSLFPWRTVSQNIGYGLEIKRVPRNERKQRVQRAVSQAGLSAFADAFPLTLSGGMRQRVSLMRSLIAAPSILLMDEPFGALDTHTKLDMHRVLLEAWERERQAVLFVTHDLGEALTLADRIILLSARPGRIKEIFPVSFARPRDAVALREAAAFSEAFAHIWHSLGEEFKVGAVDG